MPASITTALWYVQFGNSSCGKKKLRQKYDKFLFPMYEISDFVNQDKGAVLELLYKESFSTGIFVGISSAVSRRGNCMVGNTSPVASLFQRFRNCRRRGLLMMLLVIRRAEAGQPEKRYRPRTDSMSDSVSPSVLPANLKVGLEFLPKSLRFSQCPKKVFIQY